jgi:hypothetical protein
VSAALKRAELDRSGGFDSASARLRLPNALAGLLRADRRHRRAPEAAEEL